MTGRRAVQLAKRVEAWQKRLGMLGLAQYDIDRVSTTDAPGSNEYSAACVTPSANYDRAVFEFRNDIVDWAYDNENFEYLDQTIIHEWLHVVFQSQQNAIELVHNKLAPDVAEVWDEQLTHELERLIDRLARQIYAAFKSNVVP